MQDAAVACWEDRDCIYIKDIDCDQQSFQLCINGTTQNSTKSGGSNLNKAPNGPHSESSV